MYRWLPFTVRPLSARQRQIAQLRAEGLRHAQIAERLGLTVGTVDVTWSRIVRRLRPLSESERMREIWPHENTLVADCSERDEGAVPIPLGTTRAPALGASAS